MASFDDFLSYQQSSPQPSVPVASKGKAASLSDVLGGMYRGYADSITRKRRLVKKVFGADTSDEDAILRGIEAEEQEEMAKMGTGGRIATNVAKGLTGMAVDLPLDIALGGATVKGLKLASKALPFLGKVVPGIVARNVPGFAVGMGETAGLEKWVDTAEDNALSRMAQSGSAALKGVAEGVAFHKAGSMGRSLSPLRQYAVQAAVQPATAMGMTTAESYITKGESPSMEELATSAGTGLAMHGIMGTHGAIGRAGYGKKVIKPALKEMEGHLERGYVDIPVELESGEATTVRKPFASSDVSKAADTVQDPYYRKQFQNLASKYEGKPEYTIIDDAARNQVMTDMLNPAKPDITPDSVQQHIDTLRDEGRIDEDSYNRMRIGIDYIRERQTAQEQEALSLETLSDELLQKAQGLEGKITNGLIPIKNFTKEERLVLLDKGLVTNYQPTPEEREKAKKVGLRVSPFIGIDPTRLYEESQRRAEIPTPMGEPVGEPYGGDELKPVLPKKPEPPIDAEYTSYERKALPEPRGEETLMLPAGQGFELQEHPSERMLRESAPNTPALPMPEGKGDGFVFSEPNSTDIATKSGVPFKTETAAKTAILKAAATKTHEVVPVEDGFIARPKALPGKEFRPESEPIGDQTTEPPVSSIEVPKVLAEKAVETPDFKAEAERLGIKFDGVQEGVDVSPTPLFTDPVTKNTFSVPEGTTVEEALQDSRVKFNQESARISSEKPLNKPVMETTPPVQEVNPKALAKPSEPAIIEPMAKNKGTADIPAKENPKAEAGKNKILWRGEDEMTGQRTATMGNGLYSGSLDKAKRYGKPKAYVNAYPKKPLILGQREYFNDWLLKDSGEKNIREFNSKHPDVAEYIKAKGYDGVVSPLTDEVVNYSPEDIRVFNTKKEATEYINLYRTTPDTDLPNPSRPPEVGGRLSEPTPVITEKIIPKTEATKKIAPDVEFALYEMRSQLQSGEPGGIKGIDAATGEYIYMKSGYPDWFTNMVERFNDPKRSPLSGKVGISAKEVANIITKKIDGKPLTWKQDVLYNDIERSASREISSGSLRDITADYMREIGEGETADEWSRAALESVQGKSGRILENQEHLKEGIFDEVKREGAFEGANEEAALKEFEDFFSSVTSQKPTEKPTYFSEETGTLQGFGANENFNLTGQEAAKGFGEWEPNKPQVNNAELPGIEKELPEVKKYGSSLTEETPYILEEESTNGSPSPLVSRPVTDKGTTESLASTLSTAIGREIRPEDLRLWQRTGMDDLGKLGRVFQKKVVVFQVQGEDVRPPAGFFMADTPDKIYLNSKASAPHLSILGHELLHALRKDAPKIYDGFWEHVQVTDHFQKAKVAYEENYGHSLTTDKLKEEYTAEYIGVKFAEKSFWNDLANRKPGIFKKVYDTFIRLIEKIKTAIPKADGMFRDFRKAEYAASKAMADYAEHQRTRIKEDKYNATEDNGRGGSAEGQTERLALFSLVQDKSKESIADKDYDPQEVIRSFEEYTARKAAESPKTLDVKLPKTPPPFTDVQASNQHINNDTTNLLIKMVKEQGKQLLPKNNPWTERWLASPEFYNDPEFAKLVNLHAHVKPDMAIEIMHTNDTIDASKPYNPKNSITEAAVKLRDRGLTQTEKLRNFFIPDPMKRKVSKEYAAARDLATYGDSVYIRDKELSKPEQIAAFKADAESKLKEQGFDNSQIKEIIGTWQLYRNKYDAYLENLAAPMKEMLAKLQEKGKEGNVTSDIKKLQEKLSYLINQIGEWKGFYAPREREPGKYAVQAKRIDDNGNDVFYRRHANWKADAVRMEDSLRKQGWTEVRTVDNLQPPEIIMQNLKGLSVAKTIEHIFETGKKGKTQEEVNALTHYYESALENVATLIQSRGFLKTKISRMEGTHVKGYNEDLIERSLIYEHNTSRGLAKSYASREASKVLMGEYVKDPLTGESNKVGGIDPFKEPVRYQRMVKYNNEQLRNAEAGDRAVALAKSIATFKYLGVNARSLFVNTVAIPTTAVPSLHQYVGENKIGLAKVAAVLASSCKDYGKFMLGMKLSNPREQAYLEEIHKLEYDNPQYTRDVMANLQGAYGTTWQNAMKLSMWAFGKSEQWNRGSTMLAGLRLAKELGLSREECIARARLATERAHGVYGKATLPELGWGTSLVARGTQLMYSYSKFGHTYVQTMYDLGFRKHNIKAFAWQVLSPMVIGGLTVLPFRENIMPIFDAILTAAKLKDKHTDIEAWVYGQAREYLGKTGETFARRGLAGAAGADISASLSVNLGLPDSYTAFAGPAGGVADDIQRAMAYYGTGEESKMFESLLPTAVSNLFKAKREAEQGATTSKGYRLFNEETLDPYMPSVAETVGRGLGFRSPEQAITQEHKTESSNQYKKFKDEHDEILQSMRAYMAKPKADDAELDRIIEKAQKYNDEVDKHGLLGQVSLITRESFINQTKRMGRPTKREAYRMNSYQ